MLAAMHDARKHVAGIDKAEAKPATHHYDAALYRVLVVGEAATRISMELREQHADIPWTDIIGMRNIVIHGYEKVDWDVVWESIQNEFPALEKQLLNILQRI